MSSNFTPSKQHALTSYDTNYQRISVVLKLVSFKIYRRSYGLGAGGVCLGILLTIYNTVSKYSLQSSQMWQQPGSLVT